MKTYGHFWKYLAQFLLQWEMFQTKFAVKIMRIAFWITKAPHTLSEYVLVTAFPLQQWLHERASLSCYTYIACLVHSDVCHLQKMCAICRRCVSFAEDVCHLQNMCAICRRCVPFAEYVCHLQKMCVICRRCVPFAEDVCHLQKMCAICRICVSFAEDVCHLQNMCVICRRCVPFAEYVCHLQKMRRS